MSNLHHKKLNIDIPSWLWFPIYNSSPRGWSEEKQQIANQIKKSLKEHLRQHDLENDIITEPNQYDYCGTYSKNND